MNQTRMPRAFDVAVAELEAEPPTPLPQSDEPMAVAMPARLRFGPWLVAGLGGLMSLWIGLSIHSLIAGLFAAGPFWGWLGSAMALITAAAALAILLREVMALWRLRKLERLQADAATALSLNAPDPARRVITVLENMYVDRSDLTAARAEMARHAADIMDASDRIRLAERVLVAPLDAKANALIARTVKQVTLLTAVTPSPALDMLFVAAGNLRLIRQLATLYGGRPGMLAGIRLARLAVSHLAVAGGLALSDQILQHMLGKGLAGKLSARFGEGAVNGILTARLGLAAASLCRPLPYTTEKQPALAGFLAGLAKSRQND